MEGAVHLNREDGLNQGALAERIEVEPITLCRMIDRLEESGLVERRHDPADRRARRIFLTDRAHPVIAHLRSLPSDLSEVAMTALTAADQQRLTADLSTIHMNLTNLSSPSEAQHG